VLRAVVERLAELDDDVVATVGNTRVPMPRGSGLPPVADAEAHSTRRPGAREPASAR
jgi:nitronate monooxygenase